VRHKAKKGVEEYAGFLGWKTITPELLKEAKKYYGKTEQIFCQGRGGST
jgi:hypothetical protein